VKETEFRKSMCEVNVERVNVSKRANKKVKEVLKQEFTVLEDLVEMKN
jgi:hypothetical protein